MEKKYALGFDYMLKSIAFLLNLLLHLVFVAVQQVFFMGYKIMHVTR